MDCRALFDTYGFPPGFVPLFSDNGGIIGIMPEQDGKCKWVKAFKGSRRERLPTAYPQIPESKKQQDKDEYQENREAFQRVWLRSFRKTFGWQFITDTIGHSRRTWEGWEQGRHIPFHVMARLTTLKWNRERQDEYQKVPTE
jgi:hypothetical protein